MDIPRVPFKKVLVTGGAGFIGSHLTSELSDQGVEVVVADTLVTGKMENISHIKGKIQFFKEDIRDEKAMQRISEGCEAVFHLAAMVSVPQSVADPLGSAAINDMGALNVLEAARQNQVKRVVLSSSSAVYGDLPEMPKKEMMATKSLSPYALEKWIDEKWAELYQSLYGLETVCLRYFNVFGPRQDPSSPYSGVISIFMEKALKGERPRIYGDGEQTRDFVFVKDVVKANLLASVSEGAMGKVFNIGTGKSRTVNALWKTVAKQANCDLSPAYEPERPGDIRHSVADIRLAMETIGFKPAYDFESAMALTHEWYKGQKDL